MTRLRVGIGYDIHPFQRGKQFTLGGVKIPYSRGLEGHSDGDCHTHSIIDALLGAANSGDIGHVFGVDKPEYKDIMSLILLAKTRDMIKKKFKVINLDTVIVCEKPKLSGYLPLMKKHIAEVMKLKENCVSVKATTAKKLGEIGREKAISAQSIVLLERKS